MPNGGKRGCVSGIKNVGDLVVPIRNNRSLFGLGGGGGMNGGGGMGGGMGGGGGGRGGGHHRGNDQKGDDAQKKKKNAESDKAYKSAIDSLPDQICVLWRAQNR